MENEEKKVKSIVINDTQMTTITGTIEEDIDTYLLGMKNNYDVSYEILDKLIEAAADKKEGEKIWDDFLIYNELDKAFKDYPELVKALNKIVSYLFKKENDLCKYAAGVKKIWDRENNKEVEIKIHMYSEEEMRPIIEDNIKNTAYIQVSQKLESYKNKKVLEENKNVLEENKNVLEENKKVLAEIEARQKMPHSNNNNLSDSNNKPDAPSNKPRPNSADRARPTSDFIKIC